MVTLCRRSGSLSTLLVVVNAESDTKSYRDVFCLPEYSVTTAEILIPASDVAQHISIAGAEASKTSNMKFCLNGGLLLGTAGACIYLFFGDCECTSHFKRSGHRDCGQRERLYVHDRSGFHIGSALIVVVSLFCSLDT